LYFIGLDLGQAQDPSALAIIEVDRDRQDRQDLLTLSYLHRWPLGTRYPEIVAEVVELVSMEPIFYPQLVVDGTGVGAAIVDLFCQANMKAQLSSVLITAGHHEAYENGTWRVSKVQLVSKMQAVFQTNRLRMPPDLPQSDILEEELMNFRVKVTAAGNETFEAWRERDHDDLVLAVALAVWAAERHPRGDPGEPIALGHRPDVFAPWAWKVPDPSYYRRGDRGFF
jgi:hypothetical protein